ncbi:phosphate transport system permease protein [Barrientosiimonas humi]|uniref:Phosphate transport system permease protein PstA n=1 Tax=Barrientosiimonas humi TaxID=999931 RepID=A0A542XF51_9MICO|nr:phosphate ABC transporter permease PstA [Barrientosiimonas humi]TQL34440.1 phosphate transport system permease protein [Barrientosiimonas humi]CAG7574429.1 Phosphate transport system permease protein PstA 1 [Barrientosiimonas humi]
MSTLDSTYPAGDVTATAERGNVSSGLGPKSSGRAIKDRIAQIVMWGAFLVALVPLIWILGTVVVKGGAMLLEAQWWTNSQLGITARNVGGGATHAIQGTLIQGAVTSVIAVPIGVLTAIYLVEYGRGKLARAVSFMVDILTGVPSIVAALFIYAVWVTTFGFQRVPFAVCLALVLLMVPVVVRSTEEMLKLVPNELREASYALGVPKWKTIMKVVLPTAFSGIVTGILLGLARVMGETAPLIILGPYFFGISSNLFSGLMGTLPTMMYSGRDNMGLPQTEARVWGAACTLILIILVLNIAGRLISRFSKVKS